LQEDGDEPGALEHRAKFEQIDAAKGGACAYIAKYIAKNIDDAGAVGREGHRDEWAGQRELEGMDAGRAAQRVAAWASAHGIRQFQAIGQPPVGVWRELRRLPSDATGEDSQAMRAAMLAVNRQDERRACWAGYLSAQGGAMLPRKQYRLKLEQRTEQRAGVYGLTLAARPFGVSVAGLPGVVYQSQRKQWKPKGTWTAEAREAVHGEWGAMARAFSKLQAASRGVTLADGWAPALASPKGAAAWTRVNNCTGQAQKQSLGDAQAGFPEHFNKAPGGDSTTWKPPKWTNSPLPNSKQQPNLSEVLQKLPASCLQACATLWS